MCLGRFGEREDVADHGPQRALVKQGGGERAGAVAVVAEEHAMEGDVGVQQGVQVQFGGRDRGDLAAGPQRRDRSRCQRAAH